MDRESANFLRAISGSLDRIIACLDGLDAAGLNSRLPVEGANSLFAIATHALANTERNVMGTYCGEPYDWQREAEFAATGDSAGPLRARWAELKGRMQAALDVAGPAALERECEHYRLGRVPGREVLLQAARHAAEHVGEAELIGRMVRVGR